MSSPFDRLEDDLVAAAGRHAQVALVAPSARRVRALRRGGARSLLMAAVLVLAIAAAAGATFYVLRASPIAPLADDSVPVEQLVEHGTSRVLDLRAPDPGRDQPAWALRLATSRTGLICGTVGQFVGGDFGLLGLDRRFRILPEQNVDACGQRQQGDVTLLGARVFDANRHDAVRTVIYGVGGGDVTAVTLRVAGEAAPRRVAHGVDGAFLAVVRGYPEDVAPVVELRRASGRSQRIALATSEFVVIDPLGGPAWRLWLTAGGPVRGVRDPNGNVVQRSAYSCVSFMTARAGATPASSPTLCGLARLGPGKRDRTLYFDTRRLSGRGQPDAERVDGKWNGHAPRTAVWGVVGREVVKEIVVTAPGVRQTVRPSDRGGAFLVLLAASVDPRSVDVTLRLRQGGERRFGPTYGLVEAKEVK